MGEGLSKPLAVSLSNHERSFPERKTINV